MTRMMIVVEENDRKRVYTIGGDREGFWEDVQRVMSKENVYLFHSRGHEAEEFLSEVAEIMKQKEFS